MNIYRYLASFTQSSVVTRVWIGDPCFPKPLIQTLSHPLPFLAAYGNLANVMAQRGRVEEAEVAFKKALRHRPNMADAHYNL